MTERRVTTSLGSVSLALAAAALLGWLRVEAQSGTKGRLCGIVWDGETTGRGDTQSTHGEFRITNSQHVDGGLMISASGDAKVTYHPANRSCRIGSGSPFTANYTVMVISKDERTAQVDITTTDPDGSHVIKMLCPREFNVDLDPEDPPTITVLLKEGTSQPYSVTHGVRGHKGTLTLNKCTDDGSDSRQRH